MENIKNTVSNVIDAIKGFFTNLHLPEIKIPHINLPHFNISGSFSLVPPSIPSIGVNWYDQGGVFTRPSVIGIGEKRPEFVGALDDLKSIVRSEIERAKVVSGITQPIVIENYTILDSKVAARSVSRRQATSNDALARALGVPA